jgi:hypothetical protein
VPNAAASTASHPAFVAIMIRPSVWVRRGYEAGDLGKKENVFSGGQVASR